MKNYIVLLIALIATLTMRAQVTQQASVEKCVYVTNNKTYHRSLTCKKVGNKPYVVITYNIAKKKYFKCYTCCEMEFDNSIVYLPPIDHVNHFEKSAICLQKSAKYAITSFSIGLGTCGIIGILSIDGYTDAMKYVGIVGGVTATAFTIASLNFLLKSGKHLQISASHIKYEF